MAPSAHVNNVVGRGIIPILAFGFLFASAYKCLVIGLLRTDEMKTWGSAYCPIPFQGSSPYQVHYLGGFLPGIEQILCILVGFFHPLFQPEAIDHNPFLIEFGMSLMACTVVPLMESSRDRKPFYPGVPVILGLLYQMYTGGFVFPFFWMMLIVIVGERGAGSQISQAKAEGVLAAVLFGYYVPTFAMNFYPSILSIAMWQIFPLCMSVISTVYAQLRSSHAHQSSGYRTTQLVYSIIAVIATCTHMATLASYGFDWQRYFDSCIPTWSTPNASRSDTVVSSFIHILQWDAMFIFGSTFLASLWFARRLSQVIGIAVWIAIATLVVGPGAAFAAILIWREMKLKEERTQSAILTAKRK